MFSRIKNEIEAFEWLLDKFKLTKFRKQKKDAKSLPKIKTSEKDSRVELKVTDIKKCGTD